MVDEQKRTPAYVSYKTFKNTIMGMDHVPEPVDYSAFPSMNGSTRNCFFGSLRFFDLIDAEGQPSQRLHDMADASDSEWKKMMKGLVEEYYAGQLQSLSNGTVASLKKSFGDEVGASIVAPAARFLIAAANDSGVPVSSTIKNAKVGSGSPRKKRSSSRHTPRNDAAHSSSKSHALPKGTISFPIYIPGKPQGSIVVPADISTMDMAIVNAMLTAVEQYAKQQEGGQQ